MDQNRGFVSGLVSVKRTEVSTQWDFDGTMLLVKEPLDNIGAKVEFRPGVRKFEETRWHGHCLRLWLKSCGHAYRRFHFCNQIWMKIEGTLV